MAIIKVRLEAVRYLAAKAVYEEDETCKKIMKLVTYKRRGVGFNNLLVRPFYRDGNSPRALNVIADTLDTNVGVNWYKLVVSDEGINYISGVLQGNNEVSDENILSCVTLTDEYLLTFFKQHEILFVNKCN